MKIKRESERERASENHRKWKMQMKNVNNFYGQVTQPTANAQLQTHCSSVDMAKLKVK